MKKVISKPSAKAHSGYNICTVAPDIAAQWDCDRNTVNPLEVSPGSHQYAYWKCGRGHSWVAQIKSRALLKRGCPYCTHKLVDSGVNDLATLHPEIAQQWDFDKNGELLPSEVFPNSTRKIWWICNRGHSWQAKPNGRVANKTGCPYCSGSTTIAGVNDIFSCYPHLEKQWDFKRNNIDPSEISYASGMRVWWLCDRGHSYQSTCSHRTLHGSGCPYCAGQKVLLGFNDLATLHPEIAQQWDFDKNGELLPSEVTTGNNRRVWWKCSRGHSWSAYVSDRSGGHGCPQCIGAVSKAEEEVRNFVSSILPDGIDVIASDRSIISPKELDIYVPSRRIAIEFNGLYWHSEEAGKNKSYHYDKWAACRDNGISLYAIWEDQWKNHPDAVKLALQHALAPESLPLPIGSLCVAPITISKAKSFCEEHHIDGAPGQFTHCYGVYDKDNLIATSMWRRDGSTLHLERYTATHDINHGLQFIISTITRGLLLKGVHTLCAQQQRESLSFHPLGEVGFSMVGSQPWRKNWVTPHNGRKGRLTEIERQQLVEQGTPLSKFVCLYDYGVTNWEMYLRS